jgi:3D-(3,5/4)-trihydroxycyclohexane-1,2-dione acylhydrolase (decyclizing)
MTAFQHLSVRFVNVNVAECDAYKHSSFPLTGDARATLTELASGLATHKVSSAYAAEIEGLRQQWATEVDRVMYRHIGPPISQGEAIGVLDSVLGPKDVIVNAAGSLPGDLHKLWRSRNPKSYHMEYGYSCMGYEIAGGLGVKMAAPDRDVYVLVGDASYLMMAQEIVTALQERIKLNIVIFDNHGFSSIGSLSRACGSGGFGTEYRYRGEGLDSDFDGDVIPVDFALNAASLGAHTVRAKTCDEFAEALRACRLEPQTSVVVVETDYHDHVPGYESWWDVPISEVSEMATVDASRDEYQKARKKERYLWPFGGGR